MICRESDQVGTSMRRFAILGDRAPGFKIE